MDQITLGLYDKDIHSPGMFALAKEIKGLLGNTKENKRQIGVLLQQARDHLRQDKLFGKWRSLNFNDQLPQPTAYNYMTLASFGEDTGNIPESALYILGKEENELYAEDIISQLKGMNRVSIQDVKDAIAVAKGDPTKTYREKRNENDDEKIDSMFRQLSCMDGYQNQRLVELIAGRFGTQEVIGWLQEEDESDLSGGEYYNYAGELPPPQSPQKKTVLPLSTQLAVAQINEAWYKVEYECQLMYEQAEAYCFLMQP